MRKKYDVFVDGSHVEVFSHPDEDAATFALGGVVLAALAFAAIAVFLPIVCPWKLSKRGTSIFWNIIGTFVGIGVWSMILQGLLHAQSLPTIPFLALFLVLIIGPLVVRMGRDAE